MGLADATAALGQGIEQKNREPQQHGVWLRLPCCDHAVHPVRIHRHDDGLVTISAPREPHADWVQRPDPRALIALGWTDEEGSTILECRVLSAGQSQDVWTLEVVNSADYVQRRRHRRVNSQMPAQLMDPYADRVIDAQLIDISEGGMKCRFFDYVPDDRGLPQRFALRIDGAVLVVLAQMRWSGRVSPVEIHVGYEFVDVHETVLARLRAYVMRMLDQAR